MNTSSTRADILDNGLDGLDDVVQLRTETSSRSPSTSVDDDFTVCDSHAPAPAASPSPSQHEDTKDDVRISKTTSDTQPPSDSAAANEVEKPETDEETQERGSSVY